MSVAQLSDRALVRVSGPDARQLLHNVLTVSMDQVDETGLAYGGLLTPQGKIICDFLIHRAGDESYWVDLRAGSEVDFIKRMKLYRLRAKVDVELAEEGLAVFVAWGSEGSRQGAADPRLAAMGDRWVGTVSDGDNDGSLEAWHNYRIVLGIPEGGLDFEFGGSFPHDVAMDQLNGLDRTKGCYVGQEVVSRMSHRGTARRRVVLVEADVALPELGTDILARERAIGRLGSSDGKKGLGVVRLDRLSKALADNNQLLAGTVAVRLAIPSWANYDLEQFAT